jgi:hypothetical protein
VRIQHPQGEEARRFRSRFQAPDASGVSLAQMKGALPMTIPTTAAADDGKLLAAKAARDAHIVWWNTTPEAELPDTDALLAQLRVLERAVIQQPAQTLAGLRAKVEFFIDFSDIDRLEDDDVCDCAQSLLADVYRLCGEGGGALGLARAQIVQQRKAEGTS